MYNDYFGFREAPFNITPDPRFFYTDLVYQEAYASLLYGIQMRKGFIVLTGEVGVGKTTLLRKLMDHLDASVRFAFFYNTTLTFEELLSFACEELGIAIKGMSRLEKIQALNVFLINQLEAGGTGVLLIDEAQNLRDGVLEDLRLLSNLETRREKLLQIVLAGQPELQDKLEQPQLRQLKQRVAVWCQLDRLQKRKISPFIEYRLHAVGYEGKELFTPQALQRIALYSEGIPRLINVICDASLLIAYGSSQKTISAEIIEEAAQDLHLRGEEGEGGTARGSAVVEEECSRARGGQPIAREGHSSVFNNRTQREADKNVEIPVPNRYRTSARVFMFLVFFILGVGGVAAVLPQTEARFANVRLDIKNLIGRIEKRLEFLIPHFDTRLTGEPPQRYEPEGELISLEASSETHSLVETVPEAHEPNSRSLEEDSSELDKQLELPLSSSQHDASFLFLLQAGPRQEQILTVPDGSTVSAIARNIYGTNNLLGIDLIEEYNPSINNLDYIIAGQQLRIPPLTRAVLQRRQPDGTYRFILGSFPTVREAEKFVQTLEITEREFTIIPRRISEGLVLYRIEMTRFNN